MLLVPGASRRGNDDKSMRHLSLIRSFHLADFLTLANGACGTTAILLAIAHVRSGTDAPLLLATALVLAALVFDVLDGRVARWRQQQSAFGRELDSLADIVSFGAAPAAIAFAAGLDTGFDAAILVFFAMCGLSRLARFNVTADGFTTEEGTVAYFEGTPIPTSVVPLLLLVAAFAYGDLWPVQVGAVEFHLLALPFAVSGCLMVSKTLRIPKP